MRGLEMQMPEKFKPVIKIIELKPGDIIRNKFNKEVYIITSNYSTYVIGVKTTHVTNEHEWEVLKHD